jgi:arylsulfatase A-like enzyme
LNTFLLLAAALLGADSPKPNIIWFVVEDMSAHFSCYGEKAISTPIVDNLARDGTRFSKAFVTGPICSISRSAMITGMYQTAIGAQHHRSGRGTEKIQLPAGVVPVPVLFQQAGYYTSNGSFPQIARGKTDYNFEFNQSMYNGSDWAGRKKGQPFFAQVQIHGGKYREGKNWDNIVQRELGKPMDPNSPLLKLPPYYPDDPVIRSDWARYLDTVRYTDKIVGQVLERLKNEKELENTVLFFWTDHGISHARGKQFLYDEGIHVPLVISGKGIAKGIVRDDLVSHIDIAATSLSLGGIRVPQWMQGKDILAKDYKKREYIFAARDRADETVDHIRCARSSSFKYIRNYLNQRPHLQPNAYKDGKEIVIQLRKLHEQKKLNAIQELIFSPTRPAEELYDLEKDPWEINNLAMNPSYATQMEAHRKALKEWESQSNDTGRKPETSSRYDSDMAMYLNDIKRSPERLSIIQRNIQQMKEWASQGK